MDKEGCRFESRKYPEYLSFVVLLLLVAASYVATVLDYCLHFLLCQCRHILCVSVCSNVRVCVCCPPKELGKQFSTAHCFDIMLRLLLFFLLLLLLLICLPLCRADIELYVQLSNRPHKLLKWQLAAVDAAAAAT